MKIKILFLISAIFLLSFPIANAVTCKTIKPTAANATDLFVREATAAGYGSEVYMAAGVSDPVSIFYRGIIALNSTINLTAGGETIPVGAIITNMTLNFSVSEWKGGCAVFENITINAMNYSATEATMSTDSSWDNMTAFEGYGNLISNYYNMPTGINQDFLYGINLTYAQNYTNKGLGKWGEGLMFINTPCETGENVNKFSSFYTNDEANAAYHWSVTFCWTAQSAADKQEFTINAKDSYDLISLNNITISVTNGSNIFNFSTINGTIYIQNDTINSFDDLYNITFRSNESNGYLNHTIPNINITNTQSFMGDLYQAILYVNSSEVISGIPITNFWARANLQINQSNSSGYAKLLIKAGLYNISANSSGYLDWMQTINITNFEKKYANISLGKSNLTIKARSITSNTFIENFTITLADDDGYSYVISKDTRNQSIIGAINGSLVFNIIQGDYNLSINAPGFALATVSISVSSGNILPNYTFSVYNANSVNFTVYDEFDRRIMNNEKVYITFIGAPFSQNYSTTTGRMYVDLIEPADYRIEYWSEKYTKRNYYATIANQSNQTINLYLLSKTNGTDITFNVLDNSGNSLEDALIKLKRYYVDANSYIIVGMAKTDVNGQAVIDVDFNNAFYETSTIYRSFIANTIGTKIFSTSLTIKINTLVDPFINLDENLGVITSMNFNNNTQTFSFTYQDISGINRLGTLEVIKVQPNKDITVCTTTNSASAATLLCQVNITNQTGTYTARGYITINGEKILRNIKTISNDIRKEFKTILGTQGVFISILIAGTFAGIGIISPSMMIILFLTGLGGIILAGFSGLAIGLYISFAIIGVSLIYKMKS